MLKFAVSNEIYLYVLNTSHALQAPFYKIFNLNLYLHILFLYLISMVKL